MPKPKDLTLARAVASRIVRARTDAGYATRSAFGQGGARDAPPLAELTVSRDRHATSGPTMSGGEADLRLAVARGFFVLATPGLGTVTLGRTLLRYDPEIPAHRRAQLVTAALRRSVAGPLATLKKNRGRA